MKYFIILSIFLATISCKKDIYTGITFEAPVFKDSVYVEATLLNDTIFTNGAWGIATYKNFIILKAQIDDYMLHLYDKNTGERVKSFGELGRAPQQILGLANFSVNEKKGILTSYSNAERYIMIFYLDSVINNATHFMDRISMDEYKKMTFGDSYICDNNFLLHGGKCEVYPDGARFTLVSGTGKLINTYDQYPINSHSSSDSINKNSDWWDLYLIRAISPDGSKIAEVTRVGGILETFKIDNKIESQILRGYFKPDFHKNKQENVYTKKTRFSFYYLTASNNYLYALSHNGSNNDNYPVCEMQVFDWEGNPIKKYKTNKPLLNICVDENKRKVYALSRTSMNELLIISFNL